MPSVLSKPPGQCREAKTNFKWSGTEEVKTQPSELLSAITLELDHLPVECNRPLREWTSNDEVIRWIKEVAQLAQPDRIYLCDGSDQEWDLLTEELVKGGTFSRLAARPNSFACRSDPADVARVEERTFVCTEKEEDAGPTNNWAPPGEMRAKLSALFDGCMRGRTMYVIPFSMGPYDSPLSRVGVEITDSAYVVVNMRIMTRMGSRAIAALRPGDFWVPCLHSVGRPLAPGESDVPWPCNPDNTFIAHFPADNTVWSFGSGYGGNALLAKKCFALRLASNIGRSEGWLACHMLILGVTNPAGRKFYVAAAFPSQCGKTNLAMIHAQAPGWKFECMGDDISWMRINPEDGRLYAINPESGFFGVAPGTSFKSNPNAMKTLHSNVIFTNVATTDDGDVWWEGLDSPSDSVVDWKGAEWDGDPAKAAHPNARFTAPISQCPTLDLSIDDPMGVPISAILFGGRRSTTIPLVHEALSWEHGVMMGATMTSETTAAAAGKVGQLRHDPFAMLPFCGHNMADHFATWLQMLDGTDRSKLPKMFYVNWFRKGGDGSFLWPGFGENARVLEWVVGRVEGTAGATETPIGFMPRPEDIPADGLELRQGQLEECLQIDTEGWIETVNESQRYFEQFGDRLPKQLRDQLETLRQRLLRFQDETTGL